MRKLFALPLLLVLSCVQGTIEVPEACREFRYRTIPAHSAIPLGKRAYADSHYDVSEPIGKVDKFGRTAVELTSIVFSSSEEADLSFVKRIDVDFVKSDGSLERIGSHEIVDPGSKVVFPNPPISDEFQDALKTGPITLRVSGNFDPPPVSVTPVINVCVRTVTHVNGSVWDIK